MLSGYFAWVLMHLFPFFVRIFITIALFWFYQWLSRILATWHLFSSLVSTWVTLHSIICMYLGEAVACGWLGGQDCNSGGESLAVVSCLKDGRAGLYSASKRVALNGNSTSHFKYSFELWNDTHSLFLRIVSFSIFFFSSEEIYFCPSMVSPSLLALKIIYIRNSDSGKKRWNWSHWNAFPDEYLYWLVLPPSFQLCVEGNVLIVSAYCSLVHTAIWSHSTQTGWLLEGTNLEETSWTVPKGLQPWIDFSLEYQAGSCLKEPPSQMYVRWTAGLQLPLLLSAILLPLSVLIALVCIDSGTPNSYNFLTYSYHHKLNIISKGFAWLNH